MYKIVKYGDSDPLRCYDTVTYHARLLFRLCNNHLISESTLINHCEKLRSETINTSKWARMPL